MLRTAVTTLFALIGITSLSMAQDIDEFAFPNFDDLPAAQAEVSRPSAAANQTRSLPPIKNTTTSLPQVQSPSNQAIPPGKLTAAAIAMHNNADHLQYSQMGPNMSGGYLPSNGYVQSGYAAQTLASGPSSNRPLLGYMQCSPNACPGVWNGFAAQHAADQACYCSEHTHGCRGHHCNCANEVSRNGSALYGTACQSGCGCGHGCQHNDSRHGGYLNRYTGSSLYPLCTSGCSHGCACATQSAGSCD